MLLSTCRLDDLVTPPPTATLTFSQVRFADSAAHGSTALRVSSFEIGVSGTGTLSWTATRAGGSAWLGLSSTSGTAPGTVTVTLNPAGLDAGVHHDTLRVAVSGAVDATRIPVRFTVFPCVVAPLEPGTPVIDSLTTADCSAPGRPEHFVKVYRITGAGGDSLSAILDATGFSGLLVLDSAAGTGAPPLAQADRCHEVEGGTCLRYVLLPRPGTYRIEATTAAARATGSFMLNVTQPRPPNAPVSLSQLRRDSTSTLGVGSVIAEPVIVLAATPTDPDIADRVRLEAEVQPLGTSFTNSTTHIGGFGPQGVTSFVLVDDLDNHTSYRWQLRVVDETGRSGPWVVFGSDADQTDFRIAVQRPPEAPGELRQLKSNGTTAITAGGTTDEATVVFRALLADPDPDDEIQLEVEVRPVDQAFTGVPTAASIFVSSGQTASASVTALLDDTDYRWRARATDRAGLSSEWVAFGGAGPGGRDFRVQIPATNLGFVAQPTDAFVGALIDPPVQVAARDASGLVNTAYSGVITVEITPGTGTTGAVLLGTVSQTAVSGIATFHNVSVDRAGTGYRLSASAPGLVGATSAAFDVEAIAVHVVLATPPSASGRSGVPLEQQPVVQLETVDDGTPVEEEGIVVTATIGFGPEGASLSGASAVTDASGRATFEALTITGPVGGYVLEFRAPSKGVAVSDTIVLEAGPAASMTLFAGDGQTATAGTAVETPPSVLVTDAYGNPVSGVEVTFVVAGGGGSINPETPVGTGTNGIAGVISWTLGTEAGENTLTASVGGLGGSPVTFTATGVSSADAAVLVFSVEPSTVTAGRPIDPAVEVMALDAEGILVTEFTENITIAIQTGTGAAGAAFLATSTTTVAAVNGVATFPDLAIDSAGVDYRLQASATGLTSASSAQFHITPGDASRLVFFEPPGNTQAGVPVDPAVVVEARDDLGNRATGFTGPVTMAIAAGTGTGGAELLGTTVVPAVEGRATFDDLSIDLVGSGYRLEASSAELPTVLSGTFNVFSSDATQLRFTVDPTDAVAGATITPAVEVTALDEFDNPVDDFTGQITVEITDGTGSEGAVLTGNLTVHATEGVAVFPDLSVNLSGTGYTLTARSGTLGRDTSSAFKVEVGPAAFLRLTSGDQQTGTVAEVLAERLVVTVTDEPGNSVEGFVVTFAITETPDAAEGHELDATAVATGPDGRASASLTLGTRSGVYVVTVTAGDVAGSPLEFSALAVAAEPVVLAAVSSLSPTGPVGGAADPAPVVEVLDAFDNPVPGETVTFTTALGSGEVSETDVVTGSDGRATVEWTLGIIPGEQQLTVTSGVLEPVTFTATARIGELASFLVEREDGGSIGTQTAGEEFEIRVTAIDAFGNRVTSFEGRVDITSAAVLEEGGGTTPQFSLGVLDDHDVVITNTGDFTLVATNTDGGESGMSNTFTVVAGPPDEDETTATVPGGTANIATTVTITVRDSWGNVRTGGGDESLLSAEVIDGPNEGAEFTAPEHMGDGVYTMSYTPVNAGTDTVSVELDGDPVAGSPFTTVVEPAPDGTATTTVLTSSANPSIFGEEVTFTATVTSGAGTPTGNVHFRRDDAPGNNNRPLVGGVATFTVSDLAVGTRRITARYTGNEFAESADTLDQVVQAASTELAMVRQPVGSASGLPLDQQPVVELLDAGGNRVTADNSTVVSLAVMEGTRGEPGGTLPVSAAAGLATFTDPMLSDVVEEAYVLASRLYWSSRLWILTRLR